MSETIIWSRYEGPEERRGSNSVLQICVLMLELNLCSCLSAPKIFVHANEKHGKFLGS